MVAEKHLERLKDLLRLEQKAQVEEYKRLLAHLKPPQLQRKGLALLNLEVLESRVGLGGRLQVTLGRNLPFPVHQIRVGDVVAIETGEGLKGEEGEREGEGEEVSGVVTMMGVAKLELSLRDALPVGLLLRIIKLPNEVSFRRMLKALDSLKADHPLLQASFSPQNVSTAPPEINTLPSLNESQRRAVACGLEDIMAPFTLIHGPPGTGKTETLIHLIRELVVAKGKRLLVTGPSNLSVDNLVERLAPLNIPMVRLGHAARITEAASHYALDYLVTQADDYAVNKEMRKEIASLVKGRGRESREERRQRWATVKDLRRDLRQREARSIEQILKGAKVTLCTLSMAGASLLEGHGFDVVLIDEASQALEPECWIALLHAPRAVLAGDHCQLPPTITCPQASALEKTLFERLVRLQPGRVALLCTQYRMNETIMNWSSGEFYRGELMADASVRHHCLPGGQPPFLLIDTDGFEGMEEEVVEREGQEEGSKRNPGEAALVKRHVEQLISEGVGLPEISIITPYSAQVELISSLLPAGVEVGTVDGFQGRENEAVIFSLVRSNEQAEIGFLAEYRRTNVAITRARKHLCVIGNGGTLCRDPFYKRLWAYVEEHGVVDVPN